MSQPQPLQRLEMLLDQVHDPLTCSADIDKRVSARTGTASAAMSVRAAMCLEKLDAWVSYAKPRED